MKSNTARVIIGIVAVVAAVVLLVVLKEDGGDSTDKSDTTPTKSASPMSGDQTGSEKQPGTPAAIPMIVVKDGKPVGGVQELTFNEGDQIRFKVKSNESDEVHIHGYDVGDEVPAGGSVTISFPASIEGIFEAELHGSDELIAEIRVNP